MTTGVLERRELDVFVFICLGIGQEIGKTVRDDARFLHPYLGETLGNEGVKLLFGFVYWDARIQRHFTGSGDAAVLSGRFENHVLDRLAESCLAQGFRYLGGPLGAGSANALSALVFKVGLPHEARHAGEVQYVADEHQAAREGVEKSKSLLPEVEFHQTAERGDEGKYPQ